MFEFFEDMQALAGIYEFVCMLMCWQFWALMGIALVLFGIGAFFSERRYGR